MPKTEYIALTESNYVPLTQAQIFLCAKIGFMYYCEYAHLLKKCTEHTCMSAIYYLSIMIYDIQVDEDTITQSKLLHSDIPDYDLPAINFVSPSEEAQESHILEEQDTKIFTHLEKVLVHMIDEQDAKIFKSRNDYVQNKRKFLQYLKYAETWQSASVICSHAAFLCDILLIVTFITFFLKYHKTMQAMLAAFITMNMTGIPPSKANPIGRMFPPSFHFKSS